MQTDEVIGGQSLLGPSVFSRQSWPEDRIGLETLKGKCVVSKDEDLWFTIELLHIVEMHNILRG